MNYEESSGAVIFTRINGEERIVIVRNRKGIYGFPKGHMENGESKEQTALREIREEAGLEVELIPGFCTMDCRPVPKKENTMKNITYFLATYEDQTPVYQKEELTGVWLLSYEAAMERFQLDSSKRILTEARDFLHAL